MQVQQLYCALLRWSCSRHGTVLATDLVGYDVNSLAFFGQPASVSTAPGEGTALNYASIREAVEVIGKSLAGGMNQHKRRYSLLDALLKPVKHG